MCNIFPVNVLHSISKQNHFTLQQQHKKFQTSYYNTLHHLKTGSIKKIYTPK